MTTEPSSKPDGLSLLIELQLTNDAFMDALATASSLLRLRSTRPWPLDPPPRNDMRDHTIPPVYLHRVREIIELSQAQFQRPNDSKVIAAAERSHREFVVLTSRSLAVLSLFGESSEYFNQDSISGGLSPSHEKLASVVSSRLNRLRPLIMAFHRAFDKRHVLVDAGGRDQQNRISAFEEIKEGMQVNIARMTAASDVLETSSQTIQKACKETENYGLVLAYAQQVLTILRRITQAEEHLTRAGYIITITIAIWIVLRRLYIETTIRIVTKPFRIVLNLLCTTVGYLFQQSTHVQTTSLSTSISPQIMVPTHFATTQIPAVPSDNTHLHTSPVIIQSIPEPESRPIKTSEIIHPTIIPKDIQTVPNDASYHHITRQASSSTPRASRRSHTGPSNDEL